ncbi:MAG: MutS-related protein [Promethearchaeota archaeon]
MIPNPNSNNHLIPEYLSEETREDIGLLYLISQMEIISPLGFDRMRQMHIFRPEDHLALETEFERMQYLMDFLENSPKTIKEIEYHFMKVKDIRSTVKKCVEGHTLDEVELFEIKLFSLLSDRILNVLHTNFLNIKGIKLISLSEIVQILDPENRNLPTYHIYNQYSEVLTELREKKHEIEELVFQTSDKSQQKQLKQQRLEIVVQEQAEELKIRRKLTSQLQGLIKNLSHNIQIIGYLDFLLAKVKLAKKTHAKRPVIETPNKTEIKTDIETDNETGTIPKIELIEAVHPKVQEILSKSNKFFTPISFTLQQGVTIITGANMGGKTVSLKTLVVNVLLAHLGYYIYAKKAQIPLFDFICFVSDDMQDITAGLSTFGAEIINIKNILAMAQTPSKQGLIVMDEFARGTNPNEGAILVRSLAEFLVNLSCVSLITTHYDNVVKPPMVHYQVVGLKNANFSRLQSEIAQDSDKSIRSIDIIQEHMDYRLELVKENNKVPTDALNIAQLLGLDETIIENARKALNNN